MDDFTDEYGADRNYKMRVTFLDTIRSSWKDYLGYSSDSIIRDFPCVVRGNISDVTIVDEYVRCDLYTNDIDYSPSYIDIYGFPTANFLEYSYIYIYIPSICVGYLKTDQVVGDGYIKFEILEDTPGKLD